MKKLNLLMKIAICCFATTAYLPASKAQTYQWDNVAMGGGGFVSGIITSRNEQNLMYARTDVGGAYKWNATNNTWKPLLDWVSSSETGYLGVESLAIDPNATNRLYMLVGINYFNSGKTAILRSSDYGNTFTVTDVTNKFKAHGNGMGRQNGEKLQVDPNNSNVLYCGTRANGLWRSFDMGATWSSVNLGVSTTDNGNGISFVLIDPRSKHGTTTSQTIYVGVSRSGTTNLYVSKNGGSTFAGVSGAPTTYMPQRAVITTDSTLYVTYGNGAGPNGNTSGTEPMNNGAVWKYRSAVNTWTNVTPSGYARAFSGISIDPNDNLKLLLSTINTYWTQYTASNGSIVYGDRILLSTNGGTGWTDVIANGMSLNSNGITWTNGTNMHWVGCAEFDPFNTNKAWITSGQGIFSCDNLTASTTTWKFNVDGLEETVPRDLVSIKNGPLVSVIYDYDGFKHTNASQYAPRHSPTMGTTTGIAFSGATGQTLLRCGGDQYSANTLYYSTNQATSWTACATKKGYAGKVAVSANGFAFLHCPAGSSTTWRSINQGGSWAACTGISITDAVPIADMYDANKFYAYNNSTGDFLVSYDRGNSFSIIKNIGQWGSKIIRAVPDSNGHVWVAMNGSGLKYTTDAGGNFITISGVTSCAAVGFGKAASGTTYPAVYIWGTVGGVEGLYRSINKGTSWTRVNDNAHEYGGLGNGQFVVGSMNTYGRVYMSTAGRGIAYGEPTGTSSTVAARTSIETVIGLDNSSAFSMKVFPNPVVTNAFEVMIESDNAQAIVLKVMSIDGKSVATKQVMLVKGSNRIRVDEMLSSKSAMYFLAAESPVGGKVLGSIKFLKL